MPSTRRPADEDEDEDEGRESAAPARARRAPPPPAAYRVFARLRMGVWLLAGAVLLLFGLAFIDSLGAANSAPQQGAIGAIYGARFVLVYALARAADQFLEHLERAARRPPSP